MVRSVKSAFSSSFQLYFSGHGCLVSSVDGGLALECCGPGLSSGVSMLDSCHGQVRGCFFPILRYMSSFPPNNTDHIFPLRTDHSYRLCTSASSVCCVGHSASTKYMQIHQNTFWKAKNVEQPIISTMLF